LRGDERFLTAFDPELDIVIWAPRAPRASARCPARSRAIFEDAARRGLHLAVADVAALAARPWWPELEWDRDDVSVLRSCLLKPEHAEWIDAIWTVLDACTEPGSTPPFSP
jgi:hypothetical protein